MARPARRNGLNRARWGWGSNRNLLARFLGGSHGRRRRRGRAARIRIALEAFQIASHFGSALIAHLPVLFHRLADNTFQFIRQVGIRTQRGGWRFVEDVVENGSRSGSREGRTPGGHLVKDQPKGEKVGARIELLTERLLG